MSTTTTSGGRPEYLLEHSEEELRRLEAQGAFLRPSTREFLQRVGIEPGMRILDVGCGAGDVAFIASELAGPSGEVVGIDRSDTAIATATARASAKGLRHVHFLRREIGDLEDLAGERRFDAVVGRLVFVHHPDPAAAIEKLAGLIRPGGVVGFQEIDVDSGYWSTHPLPLLDALWRVVSELTRRRIFSGSLAAAFVAAFDAHGIVERRIIRSGAVESASHHGACAWVGGFARTLMPAARNAGIEVPDLDLDAFASQLQAQVDARQALFIPAHFVAAAGRLPRAPNPR
jgi:2-polyprenyl-3-methyl-5-hydroxy-6-metoxy-1,4-benzoquinol methylase